MIARLLAFFGLCRHRSRYVERRDLDGVTGVMCSVCSHCGHARPLVSRTRDGHCAAIAAGRVLPFTVARESKDTPPSIRSAR